MKCLDQTLAVCQEYRDPHRSVGADTQGPWRHSHSGETVQQGRVGIVAVIRARKRGRGDKQRCGPPVRDFGQWLTVVRRIVIPLVVVGWFRQPGVIDEEGCALGSSDGGKRARRVL